MKKVVVLVDVNNQFYCVNKKWSGRKINYLNYLEIVKDSFGECCRKVAYGTQVENFALKFIAALRHYGFKTKYKVVEKNEQYSWDVEMFRDVIHLVTNNKVDVLVLGTSSKTVVPMVEWAQEHGVEVAVVSCGISKGLKEVSDRWIEIPETCLGEDSDTTDATE